jgi:hypothetical protein
MTYSRIKLMALLMAATPILGVAAAFGTAAATAAESPVLAELFTSQSCSDCPPADALLGELAKRSGVLALSFHVDYWDRLGWKDRFSLHAATERQRRYAQLLGAQVYTPQLVVDGQAEAIGSDRPSVERLLATRHETALSSVTRDRDALLHIRIGAFPAFNDKSAADILFVTFDPVDKTLIGAGENGGRFLSTYNDVRSIRSVGAWSGQPVALQLTPAADEIGAQAAIIVQTADGVVWALATSETTALD